MKTLDEVIEKCQENVDLVARGWDEEDCFLSHEYMVDALHYLREYRACGDCSYADSYLRCAQDSHNDPLTWDELKQMEGKPVWVELLKGKWKGWDVIGGFDEDDFGVAMVTVRGDDYYKLDLGKTWNAYRKEKYESN